MMIHETVAECEGFDLLTMGQPEGPKCYCYVNHLLRKLLDELSAGTPFVVLDNEAGMEHLSRLTTNDVDLLLEVAAPTVPDVTAVQRINTLTERLPITVRRKGLVLNRVGAKISDKVEALIAESGLDVLGRVPLSEQVAELSAEEGAITTLGFDDAAAKVVLEIVEQHVLGGQGGFRSRFKRPVR